MSGRGAMNGRGGSRRQPARDSTGGAARRRRAPAPDRNRSRDRDRRSPRHDSERSALGGDQVEGRRAVLELLAAGRRPVRRLWVADGLDPSPQLDRIEALAAGRKVRVETVPRSRLDSRARTDAPQGVVAWARPLDAVPLESLCEPGDAPPFLLVAAGVTDPRNLGALLRSAECAGVTGVVLPRHRAAHLGPTVTKVAAGAVEHLAFSVVGGVPAALQQLSVRGVWTIGLAGEADRSLYDLPLGASGAGVALVLGGEERGLAPLVRRRCDEVVAIPQHGAVPSLNVGVAGAVACFEIARQRAGGGSG